MVSSHWGEDASSEPGGFPAGATLRRGPTGWVFSDDPERLLGGALAWARAARVGELHVIAEAGAGMLARRAAYFADAPKVWWLRDRSLSEAPPEAPPAEAEPPAEAWRLAADLSDAGAVVVAEHGVLAGEVLGLEVARVECGPSGPELSVGVGRHDREAHRMIETAGASGSSDRRATMARAVAEVTARRRAGAPSHPANALAPERWLRAVVVRNPDLVLASELAPISPPSPRADLRAAAVAPAVGTDAAGKQLVVVCSTGIDPELVPQAADVRARAGGGRLVLAVPERDDHRLTRDLAARLSDPAVVSPVPDDWRTYPG